MYLHCNECQYSGVNIIFFFWCLWKQSCTGHWTEIVWKLQSGHTKVISDWCLWNNPIVVYTIMNAYAFTYTSVVLYAVRLTRVSSMRSEPKQKNLDIKKKITGTFFFKSSLIIRTWIWKCLTLLRKCLWQWLWFACVLHHRKLN